MENLDRGKRDRRKDEEKEGKDREDGYKKERIHSIESDSETSENKTSETGENKNMIIRGVGDLKNLDEVNRDRGAISVREQEEVPKIFTAQDEAEERRLLQSFEMHEIEIRQQEEDSIREHRDKERSSKGFEQREQGAESNRAQTEEVSLKKEAEVLEINDELGGTFGPIKGGILAESIVDDKEKLEEQDNHNTDSKSNHEDTRKKLSNENNDNPFFYEDKNDQKPLDEKNITFESLGNKIEANESATFDKLKRLKQRLRERQAEGSLIEPPTNNSAQDNNEEPLGLLHPPSNQEDPRPPSSKSFHPPVKISLSPSPADRKSQAKSSSESNRLSKIKPLPPKKEMCASGSIKTSAVLETASNKLNKLQTSTTSQFSWKSELKPRHLNPIADDIKAKMMPMDFEAIKEHENAFMANVYMKKQQREEEFKAKLRSLDVTARRQQATVSRTYEEVKREFVDQRRSQEKRQLEAYENRQKLRKYNEKVQVLSQERLRRSSNPPQNELPDKLRKQPESVYGRFGKEWDKKLHQFEAEKKYKEELKEKGNEYMGFARHVTKNPKQQKEDQERKLAQEREAKQIAIEKDRKIGREYLSYSKSQASKLKRPPQPDTTFSGGGSQQAIHNLDSRDKVSKDFKDPSQADEDKYLEEIKTKLDLLKNL